MRLAPLVVVLSAATCAADEIPFYIGTYTSNGGSKGIYRAVLDTETGKLSQPALAAEAPGRDRARPLLAALLGHQS